MKLTGKIANDDFRSVSQTHYMAGHHKIPRIWIVVADAHRARIFTKPDGHLEQIGEASPRVSSRLGRKPNKVLGRVVSSATNFIRHRLEPRLGPDEKTTDKFVSDIASWLDNAVAQDAFDRLVLAASPKILGLLRKTLSKNTESRIIAELDKDLTKFSEKDLLEELKTVVWF